MLDVLNCHQDKYGQLMPHELLEREDIVKKTIYNPRDPIVTVFSAVGELLEFSNIPGISYTQDQAVNITYVILHRTYKFVLAIHERNCMTTVQRERFRFKQFFWTEHRELWETSNLTVKDADTHHANMVRNMVAELQKALQQEQSPTENATTIPERVDHVPNAVQSTQKNLATQLQQTQAIIQRMQMKYSAAPQHAHQEY